MARIIAYPSANDISSDDCLIGTQKDNGFRNQSNPTKNFSVGQVVVAGLGYTTYTALLTQSGGNPPVVRELYNNTGATFTWTRFSAGVYRAEADTSVFTADKTAAVFNLGGVPGISQWKRLSDTFFQIESGTTLTSLDDFIKDGYLEIRIYK